jgi:alkaline phosphatase D
VGQTKTAPATDADIESLTYAVFSRAHFANGYFHSYDLGSVIEDISFWVHVGDYLVSMLWFHTKETYVLHLSNLSYPCSFQYEYGLYSTYASDSPERKEKILPVWEQITLQDHRNRHVTYLLDDGLINMRRRAPMLGTWDDHETTDNAYGMEAEENLNRSMV